LELCVHRVECACTKGERTLSLSLSVSSGLAVSQEKEKENVAPTDFLAHVSAGARGSLSFRERRIGGQHLGHDSEWRIFGAFHFR
jgi:hypothetical protein